MPSYLRQDKQKREGKDPFQELLQLLAKKQKDVDDQAGTIIVLFGKILMYTSRLLEVVFQTIFSVAMN